MSRPYVRTMRGWWRRDPFFVRYMWREATALAVAAYAVVLLTGVIRLAQGAAAFDAWLRALQGPPAIVLHLVLLAAMLYHAVTWFEIMPKTMPALFVRGKRVGARTITRVGFAAAGLASIALLALAWMLKP
jgi:succinate dehydrogenase subunit C